VEGGGEVATSLYHDSVPSRSDPEDLPKMVGMGAECDLDRAWTVNATCPECGYHVEMHRNTCGQIECPRCYRTWARRAAERSAARVFGFFFAGGTKHKPRHVTLEGEGCNWEAYKRRLLALGFTGGVLVIHPYRIKERYRAMFEIMAERTGKNRYDIVRESALGIDALEYSPHCHFVGYGKGDGVPRDSSVYQYRVLRKLPSLGAVERTIFYLLGHSLQPDEGKKAVKYFGVCSYNRLAPSWQGTCLDNLVCERCGAVMYDTDRFLSDNGFKEVILIKKYIALGWHIVTHHGNDGVFRRADSHGSGFDNNQPLFYDAGEHRAPKGSERSTYQRSKPQCGDAAGQSALAI